MAWPLGPGRVDYPKGRATLCHMNENHSDYNHGHHHPDDYPEPAIEARAREIFDRTNTDPYQEYDMVGREALPPGERRMAGIGDHARRHFVALARKEQASKV